MKSATVSDLRDHLSDWLRQVEAGERVRVMRRDDVIAILGPPGDGDHGEADPDVRLEAMVHSGALRRGTGRWPAWSTAPLPGPSVPLLEALLADREEGE